MRSLTGPDRLGWLSGPQGQGGWTMAEGDQGTRQMNFQVPEEMRRMAEQSVTQARQALESFMQAARRTAETMEQTTDKVQAGAKDMAQRTLSAAEQNIRTSLDYAQQ